MIVAAKDNLFNNKDNKQIVGLKIFSTDCVLWKYNLEKGLRVEEALFKTSEPSKVISRLKDVPWPYVIDSVVNGGRLTFVNLYNMEQVATSWVAIQKASKLKASKGKGGKETPSD